MTQASAHATLAIPHSNLSIRPLIKLQIRWRSSYHILPSHIDVVASESETAVVYSYVRFWYGRCRSECLRHCSAGNIKSKHHLFDFDRLSLAHCDCGSEPGCFLHTDASLLDDLPLNKYHFLSLSLHWCVLMTTTTTSNPNVLSTILAVDVNPCQSQTMCQVCLCQFIYDMLYSLHHVSPFNHCVIN